MIESVAGAVVTAAAQLLADRSAARDLAGVRLLVSAGPTYEPIDPVRVITNTSSGKMGYAVAQAAEEHLEALVHQALVVHASAHACFIEQVIELVIKTEPLAFGWRDGDIGVAADELVDFGITKAEFVIPGLYRAAGIALLADQVECPGLVTFAFCFRFCRGRHG